MLRNFTWLFRYAALACLFASVYVLLLRPVKNQLLTTFRELPKRLAATPKSDVIGGATIPSRTELESLLGQPAAREIPRSRKSQS